MVLLVDDEGIRGVVDQGDGLEGVADGGEGRCLIQQRGEELALALDAVQVTHRGSAGAHVSEGIRAAELLAARLKVDARERIVDGLLDTNLHAAHGIHDVG